ncbi:DUF881 domain-containing protein [Nocardioides gansuensis]|uniref:DUF881 domain-containing protein n=1 Tax=Nocardioides gansuensis TaxID=2138300 RepID=UPI001FED2885|nr:DUF881 domain-containing protein [Nocardioides gansuensis]
MARGRALAWRIGTPVVVLASGALFAVSAEHSEGTDLRGGRYGDLASVVREEREETEELTWQVAQLDAEVEQLSAELGGRDVNRYQEEIEVLEDRAGMVPKTGPAVQVTLTDATAEEAAAAKALADTDPDDDLEYDPNLYVVHQQDIQAVVNAMWRAGATAVTLQGQRLISTTGIKCDGTSVSLHGVPYSPPYVIVGIGDQGELLSSIEGDRYLDIYREDAADPTGGVGWDVQVLAEATAPAYDGLLDLRYAAPLEEPGRQQG